jgi:hypothetical protein
MTIEQLGSAAVIALTTASRKLRDVVARCGARTSRHRTPSPPHACVGQFNVTIDGACSDTRDHRHHARSAYRFTDPNDSRLPTTVGVVAAVAYGTGERGDAAIAVDEFLESVRRLAASPMSVAEILRTSLAGLDRLVRDAKADTDPEHVAEIALAAVAVTPIGVFWVSAGDVRVYLIRAEVTHQLSRDYLVVGRQEVTAALTNQRAIDLSPAPLPLRVDDVIVLCSPGSSAELNDAAITEAAVRHLAGPGEVLVSRLAGSDDDGEADASLVCLGVRSRGVHCGPLRHFGLREVNQ